ncbi:MAG: GGDEF domain-containing protein [Actinomycetota bacterium]
MPLSSMEHLRRTVAQRNPLTIFLVAVFAVGVIGWLDFSTGIYLSFALFYLVPIGFVTSFAGRGWGIVMAVVCTAVGLIGDLASLDTQGIVPFWNAAMRLGVFVVVVVVLSQLRRAHQAERELARTDALTGVANFRWFEEEAQRAMYSSRRYGGPLSLAYLDLDGFKDVNDSFGHAAGDEVLKTFAAMLRATLRPTDLVARLGGDEFVVLMPHTDAGSAELALARVDLALAGVSGAMGIGFSAGIIQLDRAVGSIDDLLAKADEHMYEVKVGKRRATDAAPATNPVG